MAYIPPGSQEPFDKQRSYGQEPGFVSRHSGKIVIFVIALIVILAVSFVLFALNEGDDGEQTGAALGVTMSNAA